MCLPPRCPRVLSLLATPGAACRTVHDSPLEVVAQPVIILAIPLAAPKVGAELVGWFLVG